MGFGRGLGHLEGRQQLHVEGEGQSRMEQSVRGRVHGVLVVAEIRQTPFDEGV